MAQYKVTVGKLSVETDDLRSAASALFALARADKGYLPNTENQAKRLHKPHKKHNFMKKCPDCGKAVKGMAGMGIHRSKSHGVKGIVASRKTKQPELPF